MSADAICLFAGRKLIAAVEGFAALELVFEGDGLNLLTIDWSQGKIRVGSIDRDLFEGYGGQLREVDRDGR
jgi:hypothetical protein